jgi:hypothetical protein
VIVVGIVDGGETAAWATSKKEVAEESCRPAGRDDDQMQA